MSKHKITLPQVNTQNTTADDIYLTITKKHNYTPEKIDNFNIDFTMRLYYNIIAEQYREFLMIINNDPA